MPQLDKVTFLSQFFWLCVFFWGFYIIALKHFLPQMSRTLKYRKKQLQGTSPVGSTHQQSINVQVSETTHTTGCNNEPISLQEGSSATLATEKQAVFISSEKLMEHGYSSSKQALKQDLKNAEKWHKNSMEQLDQNELKGGNVIYYEKLAEDHISQKLLMQKCVYDFSSHIYLSILKSKIQSKARQKNVTIFD